MISEEEKFFKEKTPEEVVKDILHYLEETRFNFACFVEAFGRFIQKLDIPKLEDKIEKLEKRTKEIKILYEAK